MILCGAAVLAACSPVGTGAEPTAHPTEPAATTVIAVIDGDTIDTRDGVVRLIGVDAPERGDCGYAEASAFVASLVPPGDRVTLELPAGENETDQHGRILRYARTADGEDIGMSLLTSGHAVARYDSMDGYPGHPLESHYRSAQTATLTAEGTVMTVACRAAADAREQSNLGAEDEATVPTSSPADPAGEWWRQYRSCATLRENPHGHPVGPFSRDDPNEAAIYDWFANGTGNKGDGEGDGLACE